MAYIAFPVSRPFDLRRLGDRMLRIEVTPSTEEKEAIIAAYGLLDLDAFRADLEIRPWRRQGAAISGRLMAEVVQPCVVTLEPVAATLDERFERTFLPEGEQPNLDADEIEIDYEADDPPDAIVDGTIDLGAVACEQFALALDPYPRAAGATVPEAAADG